MRFKVDKYSGVRSIFIVVFITCLVCTITLGISAFLITNRNKPDNIISCEGTVLNIEYKDDQNHSFVTLNEYEYVFKVTNNNLFSTLKNGDNVKISYFKDTIKHKNVLVLKLYLNDNLIIDKTSSELNAKYISLNLLVVFTILCILSLGIRSYLKKGVEVDFFEYFAKKRFSRINNFLIDDKQIKKRNIALIIYILIWILDLSLIGILSSKFPNYPHYILPPTILVAVISSIILIKLYGYKWYKPKDVKLFVKKYIEYINQEVENHKLEQFKNDGVYIYSVDWDYAKNEQVVEVIKKLSYDEYKFYTYCYFTNDFHSAVIFICSDSLVFGEPIIMKLNKYNYNQIKKNNAKIKGLNYLLNNLEKEIIECHKNKIKYKKYEEDYE